MKQNVCLRKSLIERLNSESFQMHWGVCADMYSQNWHCWDWAMADRYRGPWTQRSLWLETTFSYNKKKKNNINTKEIIEAYMFTPGIPGPMALCGGLIPPPKFWGDKTVSQTFKIIAYLMPFRGIHFALNSY